MIFWKFSLNLKQLGRVSRYRTCHYRTSVLRPCVLALVSVQINRTTSHPTHSISTRILTQVLHLAGSYRFVSCVIWMHLSVVWFRQKSLRAAAWSSLGKNFTTGHGRSGRSGERRFWIFTLFYFFKSIITVLYCEGKTRVQKKHWQTTLINGVSHLYCCLSSTRRLALDPALVWVWDCLYLCLFPAYSRLLVFSKPV